MTPDPIADDAAWKREAFERHRREELLHFIALSPTEKLRLLLDAIEFVRSARWPDREAARPEDRTG